MNINDLQNEVWKKFFLSILRSLFILIGTWLIKNGVVDQAAIDSITTPEALAAAGGLILLILTTIWQYWRAKVNVALPEAALRAPAHTPMDQVKADVKKNLKLLS